MCLYCTSFKSWKLGFILTTFLQNEALLFIYMSSNAKENFLLCARLYFFRFGLKWWCFQLYRLSSWMIVCICSRCRTQVPTVCCFSEVKHTDCTRAHKKRKTKPFIKPKFIPNNFRVVSVSYRNAALMCSRVNRLGHFCPAHVKEWGEKQNKKSMMTPVALDCHWIPGFLRMFLMDRKGQRDTQKRRVLLPNRKAQLIFFLEMSIFCFEKPEKKNKDVWAN